MLTKEQINQYSQVGLIVVPVPQHISDLQMEFKNNLASYLRIHHGLNTDLSNVPKVIMELAVRDREAVAKLYKVSRRMPAIKKIACSDWVLSLSSQVMGSDLISCHNFTAVRFDLPGEEKFSAPPHQDFPYIQGSLNGVTIWLPFFDILKEMGPVEFVAGSHLSGCRKVRELGLTSSGSGIHTIELVEADNLRQLTYNSCEMSSNSALLFSTLLIHRSGENCSDIPRISLQVRCDDLTDKSSFDRSYPDGLYLGEKFSNSYPEYVEGT